MFWLLYKWETFLLSIQNSEQLWEAEIESDRDSWQQEEVGTGLDATSYRQSRDRQEDEQFETRPHTAEEATGPIPCVRAPPINI